MVLNILLSRVQSLARVVYSLCKSLPNMNMMGFPKKKDEYDGVFLSTIIPLNFSSI